MSRRSSETPNRSSADRPPRRATPSTFLPGTFRLEGQNIHFSTTQRAWVYMKTNKALPDKYFLDEGYPSSSRPLPCTTPKPLDRQRSIEEYQDQESPDTSEPENIQFLLSPIPTKESSNPFPFDDPNEMTTTAKEVKLCTPTDFHGAHKLTTKFLQEVEMYMRANMEIYNTEEKKVLFALSFMNGGVAGSWKQGKIAVYLKARNFGTFDKFKQAVQTVFTPINNEGVAKTELCTL
jgi:hypothetical protein